MPGRFRDALFFHAAFAAAAAAVGGGWAWAWHELRTVQGPLIIHWSAYTGISQIGDMGEIHGLGCTGILIVALNLVLARTLRSRDRRWAAILAGVTLFLGALLFTAFAAIISVNQ